MKKGLTIAKNIVLALLIAITCFVAFIGVLNICFKICYIDSQVRGYSMLPTINSSLNSPNQKGDTIYINKYATANLNDIVVADVDWHNDYIIKRIVAAPGDRLRIEDHTTYYGLYVNDKLLYTREQKGLNTEDVKTETIGYYNKYLAFLSNPKFEKYVQYINFKPYIVMPEGEYFIMGDNWGHTADSLEHGPISTKNIVGKVDLIEESSKVNFLTPTLFMLQLIF